MGRGVKIAWVEGRYTMGRGVDIPWVVEMRGGSIYHEGVQNTMTKN
jgi:hypothetical protein